MWLRKKAEPPTTANVIKSTASTTASPLTSTPPSKSSSSSGSPSPLRGVNGAQQSTVDSAASAVTSWRRDEWDSDEEVHVSGALNRKVLVVGLTGSGKSRLISAVTRNNAAAVSSGTMQRVTKNIMCYRNNEMTDPRNKTDKYVVDLFDTVGFGDAEISTPVIVADILSLLPKTLNEIHKIVFCLRLDRLRVRMAEDFQMIYDLVVGLGAQPHHICVVVTFCDFFSKPFIDEFVAHVGRNLTMFADKKIHRTYVSFPNKAEFDITNPHYPQLESYIDYQVKQSARAIFEEIIKPGGSEPGFFPNDTLRSMDPEKYNKLRRSFSSPNKSFFFGAGGGSAAIDAAFDSLPKPQALAKQN